MNKLITCLAIIIIIILLLGLVFNRFNETFFSETYFSTIKSIQALDGLKINIKYIDTNNFKLLINDEDDNVLGIDNDGVLVIVGQNDPNSTWELLSIDTMKLESGSTFPIPNSNPTHIRSVIVPTAPTTVAPTTVAPTTVAPTTVATTIFKRSERMVTGMPGGMDDGDQPSNGLQVIPTSYAGQNNNKEGFTSSITQLPIIDRGHHIFVMRTINGVYMLKYLSGKVIAAPFVPQFMEVLINIPEPDKELIYRQNVGALWSVSTKPRHTKELRLVNTRNTHFGEVPYSDYDNDPNKIKIHLNIKDKNLDNSKTNDNAKAGAVAQQQCDTYLPKDAVCSLCPGCCDL